MHFQVTVDRIEGDVAVLLPAGPAAVRLRPGAKLLWPKGLLPIGAVEGSYLSVTADLDPEATAAARQRTRELLDGLRSGPTGGDGSPTGGGGAA